MKKMFFLSLILTLVAAASAFAGGNELGNGGDLVAQEFVAAGKKLVEELKAKPDARIPDLSKFEEIVNTAKVSTAESLTLHGNEVDAINYPEEKHIDVSRSRWREYGPGKRASLVLHEYLGLAKVEDKQYEISSSYADAFKTEDEHPKNWEARVHTGYGFVTNYGVNDKATRPAVGGFLGYKLSSRSTVGLTVESQNLVSDFGYNAQYYTNTLQLTATYRYWLSDPKKFRLYLVGGAGVLRSTSSSSWRDEHGYKVLSDDYSNGLTLIAQAGLGARYSLLKDLGLDFGLDFLKPPSLLTTWKYTWISSHLGLDLQF